MDAPEQPALTWSFYLSPGAAWEAMYRDCEAAVASIHFEQYIFENDAVGKKFLKLFIDKAAQGVKVFVICDSFGSFSLHASRLVWRLRRKGGKFHFYHPVNRWNLLTPWRWFPRTHVKTLLIDSSIAYAGGVCVAERMRSWRDTQIRIEGPPATQVRDAFDRIERAIRHEKPEKTMRSIGREGEVYYVQNQPRSDRYLVYRALLKTVLEARSYIYISTAFFSPNRLFIRALQQAAERGVRVVVLVPEHSDVAVADWVCLTHAGPLLQAGVRIFHYQPTVLHNKILIADDQWATVGSTNMDIISFFRNRESNLVITHNAIVGELKDHFEKDLEHSLELTPERLAQRSPLVKIGGYLGRLMKWFI